MKSKKWFFLLITLFCLTGCTVTYDLTLDEETISETISIELDDAELKNSGMKYLTQEEQYAIIDYSTEKKYEKKIVDDKTVKFSATYMKKDFNKVKIIKQCYQNFALATVEGGYTIQTSDVFKCMTYDYNTVDKVQIRIHSPYVIKESNADEVKNNVHIWNITSSNYENKPVKITVTEQLVSDIKDNERRALIMKIIWIALGVVGTGIISFLVFVAIKNKRENKL